MNPRLRHDHKVLLAMLLALATILLSTRFSVPSSAAHAQGEPPPPPIPYETIAGDYVTIVNATAADGTGLTDTIIHGPPAPPPGFEIERSDAPAPLSPVTLSVPTYTWVFGCSAVSGAMIAGYLDRNGYSNMYAGPTAGGLMPLTDSSWPTWVDGASEEYPNNPLIASHNGVDGRVTKGSIDDYWLAYGSSAPDPFIGNWTQHTWGSAIGDYMKTSQSGYSNTDGSTHFYNWTSQATPLTCGDMVSNNIQNLDGTYGRKQFYEARGYTVTDCYNQRTDNTVSGGFSLANFKTQIDNNRPVLLNLYGHSIVGVGYDTASSTITIHDTWDTSNHTMTWGGSYSGMQLLSVSVVNLAPVSNPEIDVRGNGNSIASGDVTPSASDYTDFGNATVGGTPVSHAFQIYNTGTANLTLTGSPHVAVSGTNAADFSVSPQPTSPIGAGGNSSFTVSFNPSGTGLRTATLTILNNDSDEGTYTFAIQGTGSPPAPDLTITALMPSPSPAFANEDILVEVDVQNGGSAAGGFYVDVYVDRGFTGCEDDGDSWTRASGLGAGSSGEAYIAIPAGELSVGPHLLRAYVDTDCTVGESNEANNQAGPVSLTVAAAPAPPAHDDFAAPKVISSLAYSDSALTSGATRAADDPDNIPGCYPGSPEDDLAAGMASVWYQYTPAADTALLLDTVGSGYDTYIAVWSGTRGSLTPVACNDDIELYTVTDSRLWVDLAGGTTYHFEIGEWTSSSYWYTDGAAGILPAIAGRGQHRAGSISSTKEGSIAPTEEAAAGSLQFHVHRAPRERADFDGNRSADLGIYRPSNGVWYVKGIYNQGWGGLAGDVPVPGDYNGDGNADVAIYRPSTGVFYVKNVYNQGWGGQVGDVPVPGDYNGDGKTDVGIWRPSTGVFYVKYVFNSGWGQAGDIPVPGDYNGDGTTEVAVFHPSNNVWYIKGVGNFAWGNSGDVPVPGDYNGDGTTDIAVWRPSNGTWYVRGQPPYLVWGTSTDIPVPADYNGDGKTDLAFYTPSSGTWSVKDQFNTVWGAASDYPVEAPDTNGDGDPYQ